jgi:hypothetical protein
MASDSIEASGKLACETKTETTGFASVTLATAHESSVPVEDAIAGEQPPSIPAEEIIGLDVSSTSPGSCLHHSTNNLD